MESEWEGTSKDSAEPLQGSCTGAVQSSDESMVGLLETRRAEDCQNCREA